MYISSLNIGLFCLFKPVLIYFTPFLFSPFSLLLFLHMTFHTSIDHHIWHTSTLLSTLIIYNINVHIWSNHISYRYTWLINWWIPPHWIFIEYKYNVNELLEYWIVIIIRWVTSLNISICTIIGKWMNSVCNECWFSMMLLWCVFFLYSVIVHCLYIIQLKCSSLYNYIIWWRDLLQHR